MDNKVDITGNDVFVGMKFGKFTIVGKKLTKTHILWDCVCECGRHRYYGGDKILVAQKQTGCFTSSCGFCHTSPPVQEYKIMRRIYRIWYGMKGRCNNSNLRSYKDYGGRGINVFPEWEKNFKTFYNYVSQLDHFNEPGRSLDRIDNDGNYCPGNVRWATAKEQANNRRMKKGRVDNGI